MHGRVLLKEFALCFAKGFLGSEEAILVLEKESASLVIVESAGPEV